MYFTAEFADNNLLAFEGSSGAMESAGAAAGMRVLRQAGMNPRCHVMDGDAACYGITFDLLNAEVEECAEGIKVTGRKVGLSAAAKRRMRKKNEKATFFNECLFRTNYKIWLKS